ncbi:bifunctional ADP-dependent NAD(P)H-hydrate dehydratase/NAD(P)H-hydrate epimerase [Pseudobacillus wudalianchiensis]|uniref:Bifunctional NAD(P)H-hydrate repair enzyme n=1 Tax=Pseudobacillus wudalianchiensis TaxID=1743143 RepID=A0A1B9AGC3_9BACI|nr:bifunctional ADP-dependent NAD(P)H-hydrate dehydratase/NAD(P)H-hydrate epimerase [Bacillus wudalianchiensis]OCA82875.1 hypothetical protein A8F95_14205 [Bacillus wudalianchiensis]
MLIAGQRDMQQMDQYTMETIGLPGVVLMENAGAKVVEEILNVSACKQPKVIVLAGGGNNGGDGFVIARRLCDAGITALLCLVVDPERLKEDAKVHFQVYTNRKLPVFYLHEQSLSELQSHLNEADIIVDALLGTGVNGPLREPFRQVISLVNEQAGKKEVVSVDIPSGLNSDTGKVEGAAVQASKTISFVFPKKGFFLQDGPTYIGEWKAVDISVPPSAAKTLGLSLPKLITEAFVKASIPLRPPNGHKGTFGHVLVVGGSRQYVGAPVFSAASALHSGTGLVTLAVPESIYSMMAAQHPEVLFLPLPEKDGHFAEQAISELVPRLHEFDSIAVGPGMSRFPDGEKWMKEWMASLHGQPVVIDADGLYLIRNQLDLVRQYEGNVIFTPHPGEMASLLNMSVKEVEADRMGIAHRFAQEHQLYLLLKGHRSIIATPNGEIYVNPHGNSALGKGGSGDVLTGLIASFLAQGAPPLDALVSASYLHARAGEERAKVASHYGVMPFDIIDGIRGVFREYERGL